MYRSAKRAHPPRLHPNLPIRSLEKNRKSLYRRTWVHVPIVHGKCPAQEYTAVLKNDGCTACKRRSWMPIHSKNRERILSRRRDAGESWSVGEGRKKSMIVGVWNRGCSCSALSWASWISIERSMRYERFVEISTLFLLETRTLLLFHDEEWF